MTRSQCLVVLTAAVFSSRCALVGPACVARQERGDVASLSGSVTAGQTAVHIVPYDTRGSQNDVTIRWTGDTLPTGPRMRIYATPMACTAFAPPPAATTGDCAILGAAGAFAEGIARSLTVTHGRGNPERLGPTAQFKLWIVGDPSQSAEYTIQTSFFFGPDC